MSFAIFPEEADDNCCQTLLATVTVLLSNVFLSVECERNEGYDTVLCVLINHNENDHFMNGKERMTSAKAKQTYL